MHDFFMGAHLAFRAIYTLLLYAASAVSLYQIAKNNSVPNPWIAFIPILQYYIIGSLCEEYMIRNYRIPHLEWFMVLLELLQMLLGMVDGFFLVPLRILVNLLLVLFLHKFFYLFTPSRASIYAVLSLFGRLPLVVLLFFMKDKPLVMSGGAYPYPFSRR